MAFVVFLLLTSALAPAQPDGDITIANNPGTVSGILKDAGCPLTQEQGESISVTITRFVSRNELYKTLDGVLRDDQVVALEQKLHAIRNTDGSTPENRSRISLIRNLALILILEHNNLPLTEQQRTIVGRSFVSETIARSTQIETLTPAQRGVIETYLNHSGDRGLAIKPGD